jgi:hypothetical protein
MPKTAYGQKRKTQNCELPVQSIGENSVLNMVKKYLSLRQIPHWRINSGALRDSHNRLVRFGVEGMSDIYAIGPEGISIWIECKRPVGGRVSVAQREFLDCVNRNGGIGIVVTSIESLERQLKEAGVI